MWISSGGHFEIQYGRHKKRISSGPISENVRNILVYICAKFGACITKCATGLLHCYTICVQFSSWTSCSTSCAVARSAWHTRHREDMNVRLASIHRTSPCPSVRLSVCLCTDIRPFVCSSSNKIVLYYQPVSVRVRRHCWLSISSVAHATLREIPGEPKKSPYNLCWYYSNAWEFLCEILHDC